MVSTFFYPWTGILKMDSWVVYFMKWTILHLGHNIYICMDGSKSIWVDIQIWLNYFCFFRHPDAWFPLI